MSVRWSVLIAVAVFLAWGCGPCRANAAVPVPGPEPELHLTPSEKAWVAAHPIVRVRVSRDYPPFEFYENGHFEGISYQILLEVGKRLGIYFEPTPDMPWPQAVESLQAKNGVDLILMITHTQARESFVNFTRDYTTFPQVIFVRENSNFVSGISDLAGKTIAMENGFVEAEQLRHDVSEAKIIEVPDSLAALKMVATGQADAYVGNLAVGSYLIQKNGLANLKVAAPSNYPNDAYAMGVRKDWPQLGGILDKALGTISAEDFNRIEQKWLSVNYVTGIRIRVLVGWVLGIVGIALVFIFQLKKMVRVRTVELEKEMAIHKEMARTLKEQEAARRESERLFQAIFDESSLAIVLSDLETGEFVDVNQRYCAIKGVAKEDVVGTVPTDTAHIYATLREQIQQSGRVELKEISYLDKDQTLQTTLASANVININEKSYLLSMFQNISERKRIENELKKSEENYRNIFERAPIGIFQSLPEGTFITVNTTYASIFGFDTAEEMLASVHDIPAQLYADSAMRTKILERLRHVDMVVEEEIKLIRKDATTFYANLYMIAIRADDGGIKRLEGFLIDVSERKEFQDELAAREKRLRLYIERLPVACIVFGKDFRVRSWNPAAERMFGFGRDEVVGTEAANLLLNGPGESHVQDVLQQVLAGRFEVESVVENVTKEGTIILCEWTHTPFFDGNGEVDGMISVVVDITEKKMAQELMIQNEKMATISGLAAGLAHEINNPVGIIVQGLQIFERRISGALEANIAVADELGLDLELVQKYMEKREINDFVASMKEAGRRTSKIIANMLQFTRKTDSSHQLVNLVEVVNQAIDISGSDYDLRKRYDIKNVKFVRDYEAALPAVSINVTEIQQVIINLVKNAAQAIFEAGTIREPEIDVSIRRDGGSLVIVVADNGPGIPQEIQNRIFDPFFTTKPVGTGTGLGLSVSYMLVVNNHKGSFSVDSSPGKGARFSVRLPLQEG